MLSAPADRHQMLFAQPTITMRGLPISLATTMASSALPYPLILSLLAAALAGTAATFSIAGLRDFAQGAPNAVTVLGGVLEVAKLVVAAWLHASWQTAPRLLKWPGVIFVGAIMTLTMLGIFAFLWTAHSSKQATRDISQLQSEQLARQIASHQAIMATAQRELDAYAEEYKAYTAAGKVSKARTSRAADADQIARLQDRVAAEQATIDRLEASRITADTATTSAKSEMGAAIAVARALGGDEEMAVNFFIVLIMLPFDPLAVWLAIAASHAAMVRRALQVSEQEARDQQNIEAGQQLEEALETAATLNERQIATLKRIVDAAVNLGTEGMVLTRFPRMAMAVANGVPDWLEGLVTVVDNELRLTTAGRLALEHHERLHGANDGKPGQEPAAPLAQNASSNR